MAMPSEIMKTTTEREDKHPEVVSSEIMKASAQSQSKHPKVVHLLDSVKKTAFVVGTALLVFAAARNSITWHLQQFWGASGDFWQRQWTFIYQLFGEDDVFIGIWGTLGFTTAVFWLANLLFLLIDITGKPAALIKYKIQQDKNIPVPFPKLMKAVQQVLFNQIILGIPFSYVAYQVMQWRGCSHKAEDLPTFQWVLLEMFVFSLVEEICFYYTHRLFHHPRVYKYIHKRHHEWTAPIGLVSIYAHPVEHILSNILPPTLGPVLMGSHLATSWMWFGVALISTTVAHCGYHFPLIPSPEAHDFHHLKFNQNYGVLGILDRLHGTDEVFRTTKAYQRHILLLGLSPLTQQIPDDTKDKKSNISKGKLE
ncbi:fatty acid hydroxylase domain-containing protein 2-like [Liolophura sinensis]|uniref:fatty acid hydroxylase domain-containing protein 2-like n=1 Tax=Liolophura sinensis TaxID=3198878 RepID=UPI0031584AE2